MPSVNYFLKAKGVNPDLPMEGSLHEAGAKALNSQAKTSVFATDGKVKIGRFPGGSGEFMVSGSGKTTVIRCEVDYFNEISNTTGAERR